MTRHEESVDLAGENSRFRLGHTERRRGPVAGQPLTHRHQGHCGHSTIRLISFIDEPKPLRNIWEEEP